MPEKKFTKNMRQALLEVWTAVEANSLYPENVHVCGLATENNFLLSIHYGCRTSVDAFYKVGAEFEALLIPGATCLICSKDHREAAGYRIDEWAVPETWVQ